MKLYKFRSLANIEYTLDILLNERLHCAAYNKLNDPFEGVFLSVMHIGGSLNSGPLNFAPLGGHRTVKKPQSISELPIPGGTRVCSLSGEKSDVRMWSHYAGGHTGIAIEIELEVDAKFLYKVDYVDQLREFSCSLFTSPKSYEVLRIKSKHWEYEKEYRIISDEDFFCVSGRITGIHLGLRTSDHMREMLLRVIGKSFPIYSTKLDEREIAVELNKQIN